MPIWIQNTKVEKLLCFIKKAKNVGSFLDSEQILDMTKSIVIEKFHGFLSKTYATGII